MRILFIMLVLVLLMCLLPLRTHAAWVVQVGTYKQTLAAEHWAPVNASSKVAHRARKDGTTVFYVGPYDTRDEAAAALAAIQRHVADAFVRLATPSEGGVDQLILAEVSTATQQAAQLSRLSKEERSNLVVLDGAYHIKQGDVFTPLQKWLAAKDALD